MHLADEVSEVAVSAIGYNWWVAESGSYVFMGLQDVPVFVNDALDGWVVLVICGGEWSAVAIPFWPILEESRAVDSGGFFL